VQKNDNSSVPNKEARDTTVTFVLSLLELDPTEREPIFKHLQKKFIQSTPKDVIKREIFNALKAHDSNNNLTTYENFDQKISMKIDEGKSSDNLIMVSLCDAVAKEGWEKAREKKGRQKSPITRDLSSYELPSSNAKPSTVVLYLELNQEKNEQYSKK